MTTPISALELALKLVAAAEDADAFLPGEVPIPKLSTVRAEIEAALNSLKQQPVTLGSGDVFLRLRAAAVAAGSEAELARRVGCTKQHMNDVLSGRKEAGPLILSYLRLKRVASVHFTPDDTPRADPKPRSERRQRAWDMLPALPKSAPAADTPIGLAP